MWQISGVNPVLRLPHLAVDEPIVEVNYYADPGP